jgi:hypothetical protein
VVEQTSFLHEREAAGYVNSMAARSLDNDHTISITEIN